MANRQEIQTITDNDRRLVIKCIRINDGTGDDSDLRIVDCNAIVNSFTGFDISLTLVKILWCIGGPSTDKTVVIEWDGDSADTVLMALSGTDSWNFDNAGIPSIPNNAVDPTGDVLLTTTNFDAGDSYTIFLEFRKQAAIVSATVQTSSSSSSSTSSSSS